MENSTVFLLFVHLKIVRDEVRDTVDEGSRGGIDIGHLELYRIEM